MPDFPALAPLLLAAGLPLLAFMLLGEGSRIARAFAAAVVAVATARYLWWRAVESLPRDQDGLGDAWALTFLGFEGTAMIGMLLMTLFMARVRDRSAEADAGGDPALMAAPVDVFVATYNEPYAVLERTLVGATAIRHPDLRVWVLDDGARDWVRDLAAELGCLYVSRFKGKHAKAGNVNNGLAHALATGRRPEFVLLLDADFVPSRHILRRTLPLFAEADVGVAQTPQHFFNPDPLQANLLCAGAWPDEQRFFFNCVLPSKDAWGAAFCCGTSAVFRVEALVAAGGMATETVTEDMLTSFRLREHGWRTVFLNEPLSLGLAPEGLQEYVTQRARWCLGAIQQLRTRWAPWGSARIGFVNRVSALDGALFWAGAFGFKLLMIAAPMMYWWTGAAVMDCSVEDILVWLGPHVAAGLVFTAVIAGNRVLPVMTDVSQLLCAPAIVRTVAVGLVRPWGHPFRVTAKGTSTEGITVQWRFLLPFALIAAATLGGMVRNMDPASPLYGTPGFALNVFWSLFNLAVLAIAIAVCVELPKRRRDERFASGEAATAVLPCGTEARCRVLDISLGGARLEREAGWEALPGGGSLRLDGGRLVVPFEPVRAGGAVLAVRFPDDTATRRALIRKLFTGGYGAEVERVSVRGTAAGVLRRIFA